MTAMLLFMCLWLLDFSIAYRKKYGIRERKKKGRKKRMEKTVWKSVCMQEGNLSNLEKMTMENVW